MVLIYQIPQDSGEVPEDWLTENIVSASKNRERVKPRNKRLLCLTSKIGNKYFKKEMTRKLENYKTFRKRQCGFVKREPV